MGTWISRNFSWSGLTSRDEYRRWLPLIIVVSAVQIWSLLIWGNRGMIRIAPSLAVFPLFAFGALIWIGFILLSARRFRAAGVSRKWLLPLVFTINFSIGNYFLNLATLWSLGVIMIGGWKPDVVIDPKSTA
jgi:hypothetical protein